MRIAIALSSALLVSLAACGGSGDADDSRTEARNDAEAELPAPGGAARGSVTGMPAPGSGEARVSLGEDPAAPAVLQEAGPGDGELQPVADLALLEAQQNLDAPTPVETLPAPGDADAGDAVQAEQAMSTIQRYYSAISAGDYGGAHRLWSGAGSASGQSPAQFAAGFADTADVQVHMMQPIPVEGAAGSRYIRVPVTINTTRRDGSTVQFTGSYTLRQPNDDRGNWSIDSADLREVQR